ncbi:MAG: hypothetical protein ABSH05_19575 [Bryobacteraceae bacterium]|jgi:ribosome maturation protein Sdo1
MANENSPKEPGAEIIDRLFGEITELSDEELDALYRAVTPDEEPSEVIHRLAEEAAVEYRKRQEVPPEHVQAALDATRSQTSLEGVAKSTLKGIVEALKPPALGPVADPSFAFHKQKDLTEQDRRILEEQAKELEEDWGDEEHQ